MLKTKGIISPLLPTSKKTGNHCYSESFIPHPVHLAMPSSPYFQLPTHLLVFLYVHLKYANTFPAMFIVGPPLSSCFLSPLCLLCSYSSVPFNSCRTQGSPVLWEGCAREPDQEAVVYTDDNPQTSTVVWP